jgi:ATP-dependent DNA helicase RecQ
VYQALVNYLQIPINTGEQRSFVFRFDAFIRNFGLTGNEALYAIKALESDGWLDLNERNFTPSTLVFTTTKNGLYEFQKAHGQHELLLTTLLRTYGGIFDFPAFISEQLIARLLKKEPIDIKLQLQTIASFGIISYNPLNEEPQVFFKKNRVAAEDLMLNLALYNKRKDIFVQRAAKMIEFAKTTVCRSHFISTYFGDPTAKDCGVCDNCLNTKSDKLSSEEFEAITAIINDQLAQKSISASELLNRLGSVKKEKAWKVIEFMQAEKKIRLDEKGFLLLTKK